MTLSAAKKPLNIIIALIAIGIVVFYSLCGGTCSYLRGTMLGLDLKYAGIAYMLSIIVLSLLRWNFIVLLFVCTAAGVEAYLIGFQIVHSTYCPFCLGFGVTVIAQVLLNFNWSRKWYMTSFFLIGIALCFLFFKGSVIPMYS